MKIVVFDLDETLGYFVEFGMLWESLINYLNKKKMILNQNDFNNILDLYPEFLRPNIINILNYLKGKKDAKCCDKMMIYTNNQGPNEWSKSIIAYFENKINYKLFDQIISAFKINGKKIELCRTTNNKTHSDFIKCTKIPVHSQICFLDDVFYPEMSDKNVYYINVKPYIYDLDINIILDRFINSEYIKKIIYDFEINDFKNNMIKEIDKYNYDYIYKNLDEYEIDKILGKKILLHLNDFFNKYKKINSKTKTKKKYYNKKNKTFKK